MIFYDKIRNWIHKIIGATKIKASDSSFRPRFASNGHVTSRVARVPRIRGFARVSLDLSSMSLIMNHMSTAEMFPLKIFLVASN